MPKRRKKKRKDFSDLKFVVYLHSHSWGYCFMAHSSSGQDARFSSLKQEFDSPMGCN